MATLLLIPLDDTVVFPTMDVTLPVDVGDDERVLLVPRHDGEYASVGTIARVTERVRLPGGARGAMLEGVARGIAGAAQTDARGRLRVEVTEHPDDVPVDGRTRDLEREYRATIEEILELRGDDGRISAWVRAISEPGALADTSGYAPDLTFEQKVEILRDARRHRAPREGAGAPARAPGRAAGAPQDPRRRRGRRRQAAARVRAAQADGVDPPRARRGRRLDRRRVPHEDRGRRHARRRARAGRARARPPRAHGRGRRRGQHGPHLPGLARSPCRGARAPRIASTPCTRARSSTPTTPASTTSRTASSSTSRSRSCAPSATSPPTASRARS